MTLERSPVKIDLGHWYKCIYDTLLINGIKHMVKLNIQVSIIFMSTSFHRSEITVFAWIFDFMVFEKAVNMPMEICT